jgi:hypothetical protein
MIGHNKGIANVAVLKQWVIVPNEAKYFELTHIRYFTQ